MKKITLLIFIFSLQLMSTLQVHAQEQTRSITLSPPVVETTLNPGETSQGVLKISNNSSEMLTFSLTTADFIVQDMNGTPEFFAQNALDKRFAAASWITTAPAYFSLQPSQTQEIFYSIDVGQDVRPGGHYVAVLFRPQPTTFLQTGAAVETRIAALFYILVNGETKEEAIVSHFSTPTFLEYGPITTTLEIQNNGDTHIKPAGKITLIDMFGKELTTQEITTHNIFPGATREFENSLSEKWLFGRYQAKFTGVYGKGNLPLTATTTFYIIPWKILLILFLAILSIILFFSYKFRPFGFWLNRI